VNDVGLTADTFAGSEPVAPPTAEVGITRIDFGDEPYDIFSVMVVSHVVGDPVPAVILNDPAASVDPAVITAVAPLPQFVGLAGIVGEVVCVERI
jgi:hypothetical protein